MHLQTLWRRVEWWIYYIWLSTFLIALLRDYQSKLVDHWRWSCSDWLLEGYDLVHWRRSVLTCALVVKSIGIGSGIIPKQWPFGIFYEYSFFFFFFNNQILKHYELDIRLNKLLIRGPENTWTLNNTH